MRRCLRFRPPQHLRHLFRQHVEEGPEQPPHLVRCGCDEGRRLGVFLEQAPQPVRHSRGFLGNQRDQTPERPRQARPWPAASSSHGHLPRRRGRSIGRRRVARRWLGFERRLGPRARLPQRAGLDLPDKGGEAVPHASDVVADFDKEHRVRPLALEHRNVAQQAIEDGTEDCWRRGGGGCGSVTIFSDLVLRQKYLDRAGGSGPRLCGGTA